MLALKKLNKKQSILGLIPMLNVLESAGVNPETILHEHGISLDNMSGAALIDLSVELGIVADALAVSNDPLLGLKAGKQVTFTSYGTFAMLAMSAPNFLETLKVSTQFQSLSLLISHMTLHIERDWVELRYTVPDVPANLKYFIADRDLMGTYIFMREFMTDPSFYLLGAGTARPKPSGAQWREYREHIDIEMQFDQPYNWFRVPSSILSSSLKHSNHLAHRFYRLQAQELLRMFYPDSGDVVAQTKQILLGYERQFPAVADMAKTFGFSERTYHRKLDQAHTSYRELVDNYKKERCLDLLSQQKVSVAALAETMGYAESSSFLRAFKRWTGTTPKKYTAQANSIGGEREIT